jgi:hypothetical protein
MRRLLIMIACVLLASIWTNVAGAGAPSLVNYSGVLTDGGGFPQVGTFSVQFRVYDVESSEATPLWAEVQSVTTDADGRFSVLLGSVTPLTSAVFAGIDRWLGVRVGADPEMTPRTRIGSVPYALRAATVDASDNTQEPGIASNNNNTTLISMDAMATEILVSRSITVPAAGYVLAIATCHINAGGVGDSATFWVQDNTGPVIGSEMKFKSQLAAGVNDAITLQAIFQVTAGAQTFSLRGMELSGSYYVLHRQLSLVWFPTAYGLHSQPSAPAGDDEFSADSPDPSSEPYDLQTTAMPDWETELTAIRKQAEMTTRRLSELEERLRSSSQVGESNRPRQK